MNPFNIPETPKRNIIRDSLINGLVFQLTENPIIAVTGQSSVGKTTLLSQFYQKHQTATIAIFLSGLSPWAYDFEVIIEDLCNQAKALMGIQNDLVGPELQTPTSKWRAASISLSKWANSKKETVYFALDGLDEIPAAEDATAKAIFSLLPLGIKPFKFLISGKRALTFIKEANAKEYGEFQTTAFTVDEASKYLAEIISKEHHQKIYNISRGLPGYYAGLLRAFPPSAALPAELPATIEKIFEYEWSKINGNENIIEITALLCFDKQKASLTRVTKFLNISADDAKNSALDATFLDLKDDTITFSADGFKPFARAKLAHMEKVTIDKIIDRFLLDKESDEKIKYLPELLSRAGRYSQVIDYLDDQYIIGALRRKKPARFVQERTIIGLRAAFKNDRVDDVIKFGLQGANLDELYLDGHWASRIRAFISVGEIQRASQIARSFTLGEDRLQALSVIAAHQKERGIQIDPALLDEITREHATLDKEHLGERAYDIAVELVSVAPRLALALLENRDGIATDQTTDSHSLAKSTVPGTQVAESTDKCAISALEILRNRISNPAIRSYTRAIEFATKNQSADEVISEVSKMPSDEERSYFLRIWLAANHIHANREPVVKFALNFGRSSRSITPTPGFYLDVLRATTGLPSAPEILAEIRSMDSLLKKNGPTVDYYRMQFRMLEIQASFPSTKGLAEYSKVSDEAKAVEDLSTRALLATEELLTIHRMKEKGYKQVTSQQIQTALNVLDSAVTVVLERTADHYQCLKTTIRQLARLDFARAHDFSSKINTEIRRDKAYCDVIYYAIARRVKACDISLLEPSIASIKSESNREQCVIKILERLASDDNKIPLFNVMHMHTWCTTCASPDTAATALGLFIIVLIKYESKSFSELKWVENEIFYKIELIPSPLDKIQVLHRLSSILSDYDRKSALKYLDRGETQRQTIFINSHDAERCLAANVSVAIRAFSGLAKRRAFTELQFRELKNLIAKFGSRFTQIHFLSELSVRLALEGDIQTCKRIVTEDINPLFNLFASDSTVDRSNAIVEAAVALYFSNTASCLATIDDLDPRRREDAALRILRTLTARLPPDEPQESRETLIESTTTEQILEILKMADNLEEVGSICYFLRLITLHLSSTKRNSTKAEIAQLVSKIESFIAKKLPSPRFTAHLGYKLLGQAYVLGLKQAKYPEWEILIDNIRKIPNGSDRAFLLSTVSEYMGIKLLPQRKIILSEALDTAKKIPVAYDRAARLLLIAESSKPIDRDIFKRALGLILDKSQSADYDDRSLEVKKQAVDLAYQEDETYANSLVSALDDEPLRDIRKVLDQRLAFLGLQTKLARRDVAGIDLKSEKDLPRIFWKNLRQLNAGLMPPPAFRDLAPLFISIEGRRIQDIFPILSFGIESCVRNYRDTEEAFGILSRIFKVCLGSAKLFVGCLAEQNESGILITPKEIVFTQSANTLIVKKGEKPKAVEFIRQRLSKLKASKIYVADPYFTADEMDLIKELRDQFPDSQINVVTGKKKIDEKYSSGDARLNFKKAWAQLNGPDSGSDVRIYVVGDKVGGASPIHDRFILLDDGGVKLGGSWNGVGGDKETDLSALGDEDCAAWRSEIEQFAVFMHALHNGARIEYDVFSI